MIENAIKSDKHKVERIMYLNTSLVAKKITRHTLYNGELRMIKTAANREKQ